MNDSCIYLKVVLTCLVFNTCAFVYGQYPFVDITHSSDFSSFKGFYGISIGDFNSDKFEDILVTFLDDSPRLFLNQRDNTYKDVTEEIGLDYTGLARTAIWIDVDNDGWLDLFVAGRNNPSQLYHNESGTKFSNVSDIYGIRNNSNTFSVNLAELTNDPYLDIYVSNFLEENELLINEGQNKMTNRINHFELWDSGKSMASIFFDYDNDGDDDLYLVHDGNQPNILYQRQSDNTFVDVSISSKSNIAANGMGADIGDINNDGCLDIYITNLYENNLLFNNCDGTFSDISVSAGVADYGMGWGITFLDFNNDGNLDILICNDSYFSDYSNILYQNNGDLTFKKVELPEISGKTASYGCTCTDIDLDGKVDIAIANQNQKDEFQLLRNIDQNNNKWVGFYLEGSISNRQAIGSRIEVLDSIGNLHTDQVTGGNGYATQGSPLVHFGLGDALIEDIKITWTDGMHQNIEISAVDQYYHIKQGELPRPLFSTTATKEFIAFENSIKVFPNPAADIVTLEVNSELEGMATITIQNILGNIVHSQKVDLSKNSKSQIQLSTKDLDASINLVSIKIGNYIFTKKLIIRH